MKLVTSTGMEFELNQPELIIGRTPDCQIQVDDARVSSRHAILRQDGSDYVLADAGSTNGTFINGIRLTGLHYLQPNDQIQVGSVTLTVRVDSTPTGTLVDYSPPPQVAQAASMPQVAPPPPSAPSPNQAPPPLQSVLPVYGQAPAAAPGGQAMMAGAGMMPPQHMERNYFWRAVLLLFVLYPLFAIPGFIFNFVFMNSARQDMRLGYNVRNRGCLTAVLIFEILVVLAVMTGVLLVLMGVVPITITY